MAVSLPERPPRRIPRAELPGSLSPPVCQVGALDPCLRRLPCDKHQPNKPVPLRRQDQSHQATWTGSDRSGGAAKASQARHTRCTWALPQKGRNLLPVAFALKGDSGAAVALSSGAVTRTPRCFVQMELTRDLEWGIRRIEMCSSVKLKGVQHDTGHYVLGLVGGGN